MSFQDFNDDRAEIERVNAELTRSLVRCQRLLFDYRSEIAANSNMPELLDDDEKSVG
jgi:hypothetical protein